MTDKDKDKIKETIDSLCEILGFNKPIDVIKCCSVITGLYNDLEQEIAELKAQIEKMKKEEDI